MASRPDPARSAPAVIAAGGVFLPAEVCHPLWLALRKQLAHHRAEGGRVRPEVAAALDTLRAASLAHLSATGHPARTSLDIEPPSAHDRLVTTEELAGRLGVTGRHVLRLAAAEGITPVARGRWLPDDAQHLVNSHRKAAGCPPLLRSHPTH
ncbi:hypothetical protein [Streptomyces sp. NPDC000878]